MTDEVPEKQMVISEKLFDTFLKLTMHMLQVNTINCYNDEMAKPRYAEVDRLVRYGWRAYSQTDEDGIIQEIFRRISAPNKTFVEIGIGDGTQCNTAKLLVDGWRGIWIEGYLPHYDAIIKRFTPTFIGRGQLGVVGCAVTMENINEILVNSNIGSVVASEIDLLSIDIDGNDYWLWKAIDAVNPRVVCIEYNAVLHPPMSVVMPYNPTNIWDGTNYFGASLNALVHLGNQKKYQLVGCNFSGSNAFFVRNDLIADNFKTPFTAEEHYEPLRYFAALAIGHTSNPSYYEHVPPLRYNSKSESARGAEHVAVGAG